MPEPLQDPVGAFVPGPRADVPGAADGPLSGLSFAIKDLYDLAGWPTTYGSPDWARSHPVAAATAPCVLALLEAGAHLRGKTCTVELAYGLTGENHWHGTPRNPAAPDRFPGGSSSGSAAAVAAGLVAFALGSDTGGSVRIPASYCGVFGIRPSWGAVNLTGACGLGPSFDTAGWFAARADLLLRVGEVLLPEPGAIGAGPLGPLLKPEEPWINALPGTARAMAPALDALEALLGKALQLRLAPEGLDTLYEHFRCVQAQEAWATLGGWIESAKPDLGPGVRERFAAAKALDPAKAAAGRAFRRRFRARMEALLAGGAVLAYPTAPMPAPKLGLSVEEQTAVRERTMGVTAIAGLAGLPEVSVPVGRDDGAPVGLSLIAGPGRDRALLGLAARLADALGLPR